MPRFLILRFSSIGDIVLTTPVVRCLKNQVSGAEVHFLTKPQFAGILAGNPYLDNVLTLKPDLKETIQEIKQGEYDYLVDLHHNLRTWNIKRQLKNKSFSFNKLNFEKWLLVNFKIDKMPDTHIVDRYLATVSSFGVKDDGKGLDFFIPNDLNNISDILPDALREGYVCAVLGANHATKQIPFEKLTEILNTANKPVCLIGGKDVEKLATQLAECLQVPFYNSVGNLSLQQSAAIIRDSRVVLTPDTGMMHIAAALNKNIISLWGNTVPELGMYPFRAGKQSAIFETKGLKCRPCSKLGYKECPKKTFQLHEPNQYKSCS